MIPTARPRFRVVIDNDWAGDPDGLLALAHHVLSPGNRIEAVTTSFLDTSMPGATPSVADSSALARELLELLDVEVPVHDGAEGALGASNVLSAASRAILEAARRDDPLPLVIVCAGPLTNVAEALVADATLAERMSVVWVGGSIDPGLFEYNRHADPVAAERVLTWPGLTLEQFPVETYGQCRVSGAELEAVFQRAGRLGQWLGERYAALPDWVEPGEAWVLGDSPPVLVTALRAPWDPAPVAGHHLVHRSVDTRLLVGDLMAKFVAAAH